MTHPIVPPGILLDRWYNQFYEKGKGFNELLIEAAQWGADTELENCCDLFESNSVCGTKFQRRSSVRSLRAKRRPQSEKISLTISVTGTKKDLEQVVANLQHGQGISLTVE